ncbi:hypothetical protein [Sorangium atrum]|uniref:Uncharacterized protein n=1 Tax=Sorangium atrum TaxID=2995308 RepID=A0ABT5C6X3_9BACT|nr:hypothetical protein [Sorangium aterium]MDC0681524.1 hypothetical protein [Sorangium aterium]
MIARGLFDELHIGEIDPGRYHMVDRTSGQTVGFIMVRHPDLVVVLFSGVPTVQGQNRVLDLVHEDPAAGKGAFTVKEAVALAPNGEYRVVYYSGRMVATHP